MKTIRFLIILLFLSSCNFIKTTKLLDGLTKIPLNKDFFDKKYSEKFEVINLKQVDFNSIYIASLSISDNGIYNLKSGGNPFIRGYKFYENGRINSFSLDKYHLDSLKTFDPIIRGYRGITYIKKEDTLVDIYLPISDNYRFGKSKYKAKINSDTLFLIDQYDVTYIYLKKELSKENQEFKANW